MTNLNVSDEQLQLLELRRVLVVDLELTCGVGVTPETQDIIEAGFCVLELGRPVLESDASSLLIKPERSPITDFCTNLTGITREMMADQPNFLDQAAVIREIFARAGADAWVSWGQDHTLTQRQSLALGIADPFAAAGIPHIDLKPPITTLVFRVTAAKRPEGSSSGVSINLAMKALGLSGEGQATSAKFDAYNAARILFAVRRLAEPMRKLKASPRRDRGTPKPARAFKG